MTDVKQIFKIREQPKPTFKSPERQSIEATEDYAVKKVVQTKELYAENITGDFDASKLNGYELTSVAPTDGKILVYRVASSAYVLEDKPTSSGTPTWGTITGTLSSQTDLQNALNAKADDSDLNSYVSSTSLVTQLNNKVSSTSFNTHVGSTAIHFLKSSIDHTSIQNIGSNTHAQIDTHIGSTAIHRIYTGTAPIVVNAGDISIPKATTSINGYLSSTDWDTFNNKVASSGAVDHTHIQNRGTNTHAQIDTHISSTAIHFTKASISHTQISDIGTNTHAQLDTHVSSTAIHFTKASITDLPSGCVAYDHGTAATDMIVNVCYGTSATPPTASNTTEGTLYIKYTP